MRLAQPRLLVPTKTFLAGSRPLLSSLESAFPRFSFLSGKNRACNPFRIRFCAPLRASLLECVLTRRSRGGTLRPHSTPPSPKAHAALTRLRRTSARHQVFCVFRNGGLPCLYATANTV